MITKTSFKHPTALKNLKLAILKAVKEAVTAPGGVSIQPVYNRSGQIYLAVLGIKGKGYKIQNKNYDDITDVVNVSLREYHDKK